MADRAERPEALSVSHPSSFQGRRLLSERVAAPGLRARRAHRSLGTAPRRQDDGLLRRSDSRSIHRQEAKSVRSQCLRSVNLLVYIDTPSTHGAARGQRTVEIRRGQARERCSVGPTHPHGRLVLLPIQPLRAIQILSCRKCCVTSTSRTTPWRVSARALRQFNRPWERDLTDAELAGYLHRRSEYIRDALTAALSRRSRGPITPIGTGSRRSYRSFGGARYRREPWKCWR
jgi:hypothetical protein